MSENYDAKLCEERKKNVDKSIEDHEKRLNNHAVRLDKLEQNDVEHKTEIKNLCKDIQSLISTIKWGLGVFITVVVAIASFVASIK